MAEKNENGQTTEQQAAELLERDVRHMPTAKMIRKMSVYQLRQHDILDAAFQQGWEACVATVGQTMQRIIGRPPRRRGLSLHEDTTEPGSMSPSTTSPPRSSISPEAKRRRLLRSERKRRFEELTAKKEEEWKAEAVSRRCRRDEHTGASSSTAPAPIPACPGDPAAAAESRGGDYPGAPITYWVSPYSDGEDPPDFDGEDSPTFLGRR